MTLIRVSEGVMMPRSRSRIWLIAAALGLFIQGCSACTEQHDPRGDWKKFEEEQKQANAPQPLLAEGGKLPPKEVSGEGEAKDPVRQKYDQFCASCHGSAGDGNAPAAAAMNPKPRNFTDAAWQNSVDDARIAKVIKEGGASVGLSPTMAPWGGLLNAEELEGMVKLVRSFKP